MAENTADNTVNNSSRDQQHPQYATDREQLNQILAEMKRDPDGAMVLAEIARLRIRYMNFPGARDIQRDLDAALLTLEMTEAELYAITRRIHARTLGSRTVGTEGSLYTQSFSKRDDWA
ncbi:MAG: DUF3288 family protein [Synechococcaceae cyanobacterium SM2_3_2]|nr:DUF3288 family protein [Synechococcaceae cyanobacterium SM2_3_2]